MALAQTAELMVLLTMKDEMTGAAAKADASLAGLNRTVTESGTGMAVVEQKTGLASRAVTGLGGALDHAKGVIGGVVTQMGLLGGTVALFAGPAALGAAVKGALTFQQQMEMIRTQAGASQAEVNNMSKALLTMGASTSYSANELALGLYHVESVGIRGAKALDVLTAAAKGARMGNADLEQTTTALVAAVYSGIKGTGDLSQAMGSLDAIVGAGNMRMQDFVNALGTGVLASARAVGLSLNDVGAAMAVLVDQGVPAAVAATRLRTTFGLIEAPSKVAQGQLKAIGITSLELANDMRKPDGLINVLQDLHDHLQKAGDISKTGDLTTAGAALVYRSFGASRSGTTMVTLLDSMTKVQQKYGLITKNAEDFTARVGATTQTAAYHFAQFQAAISNLGTSIGQVLLPMASQFAAGAAVWLTDNQSGIVTALEGAGTAVTVLATGLGTVLSILGEISRIPIAGTALDLLVGGAIAGKASSMLFGSNPFTWAMGQVLGKLGIGGRGASALAGGGGILSSITGMGRPVPVYVVNMGPGGMGSGLAGEAGVVGGGGLSPLGIAASVGGGLAIAAAFKTLVQDPIYNKMSADIRHNAAQEIKAPTTSYADLLKGYQAATTGLGQLQNVAGPLSGLLYGQQISDLQKTQQMFLNAMNKLANPAGASRDNERTLPTAKETLATLKSSGINLTAIRDRQQQLLAQGRTNTMLQVAATRVVGQQLQASQQQGFAGVIGQLSGVIAAIFAVGSFGSAAALGRGTSAGGRVGTNRGALAASLPVGTERNRGYVTTQVNVNVSARSNAQAAVVQSRYGATPASAGAS